MNQFDVIQMLFCQYQTCDMDLTPSLMSFFAILMNTGAHTLPLSSLFLTLKHPHTKLSSSPLLSFVPSPHPNLRTIDNFDKHLKISQLEKKSEISGLG